MSTSYEAHGRSQQKRRSRDVLIAAAVSRPTAYRYFPNQRALLAAAHPETVAASLLPPDPPDDPAQRLEIVVCAFLRTVVDTEPQSWCRPRSTRRTPGSPGLARVSWRRRRVSAQAMQVSAAGRASSRSGAIGPPHRPHRP